MKNRFFFRLCHVLALALIVAVFTLFTVALAEEDYMHASSAGFTLSYTQRQAEQYKQVYEQAKLHASDIWESVIPSIEFRAMKMQEAILAGEKPDGMMDGLPTKLDLTQEEALFTAYAALETRFSLTEEVLSKLYPKFRLDIANPEQPIWLVEMGPIQGYSSIEEVGSYAVYIQSRDGAIVTIITAEDAVG